jgi:hypothetical protein
MRPRFAADWLSFPVPGVSGWQDRAEGPLWIFGDNRYWPGKQHRGDSRVPYCVMALGGWWPTPPSANTINPPCRHTPGFPCCRIGQIRGERPWWRDR